MSGLHRLASSTVIAMYVVLVMGALVTNTGSGEGCGASWPLCNGQPFPIPNFHTLIEYSHRAVTGVATILLVLLCVWAWRRLGRARVARLAAAAAGFFVLESLLGAVSVLWEEPDAVLALHFGVSLAAFGSTFLLGVTVWEASRNATGRPQAKRIRALRRVEPGLRRLAGWGIFLSCLVIYLGAYVRHAAPGLACQGWPLCNGSLLPALQGAVAIQFTHRLAAALLLLFLLLVAWRVHSQRLDRRDIRRPAVWAAALALAQVLSGAVVVFDSVSTLSTMLHAALIPWLFASQLYLYRQAGTAHGAPAAEADTPLAAPRQARTG